MIVAKLHKIQDSVILACCDADLIGKVLEEGDICLEANEKFYKDKEVSEAELSELLEQADTANILGNEAVKVALENGYASEEDVIKIKNVSHLQIFKI